MKNFVKIYLRIIFLFVLNSFSQTKSSVLLKEKLEFQINKADSLFESGNLNQSLKIYKSFEKKLDVKKNKFVFYKIAVIYALKKQKRKSFAYINKVNKHDSTNYLLKEANFYNLINDKKWHYIENKQLDKIAKINNFPEYRYFDKIAYKMFIKDQSNYYELEYFKNKTKYEQLKKKLNKENLIELDKIIGSYGFPTISKFGVEFSETAFLIIQHQEDLKRQQKYLELLENLLKDNEVKKLNYAYLKDRVLTNEGKKQIFGSQLSFDEVKKVFYFDVSNLIDPQNVDQRRKNFDLEPISDYLKRHNIIWNPSSEKLYPEN